MSGRGATAAVQAEFAKAANKPFHLCQVQFDAGDGGTVYMTDSYRPVVWNGNTYQALGHFLTFSQLEESAELKVTQAAVQLSGVDQVWISEVLSHQYLGRTLVVYKGFFDANETLIIDPFPILQGPMDAPVIDEDPTQGSCTVTVMVTSLGADIQRPAGRHTNLAEQQIFFPSDTGFKFAAQTAGQIDGRQVYWGQAGTPPT